MPLSKAIVRFKILTCGDVDEIDKMVEMDKENNIPVNNYSTYRFEKMIVEVNGNRDRTMIRAGGRPPALFFEQSNKVFFRFIQMNKSGG